jgi:hypothetical protein
MNNQPLVEVVMAVVELLLLPKQVVGLRKNVGLLHLSQLPVDEGPNDQHVESFLL